MNQTHQAEALAQYLDALLQGEESAIPAAVDAEIAALGELGRSLAGIEFRPRPAHQARVEDLLQKHRPTLPSGGATTPHGMWGIPLRWLFVLGALLAGALVFVGVGTLTDVFSRGEAIPTPALSPEVLTPEPLLEATAVPSNTPTISLTITSAPALVQTPTISATLLPVLVVTPMEVMTPTVSVTLLPALVVTPTDAVTPTAPVTPTATLTPTTTVTPTVAITPTSTVTPTPTVTAATAPTETGRSDLAFHPEHLNAGGVCESSYSASGSLKNHGPDLATEVEIVHEVVSGARWVDYVEVVPAYWEELGTSKPGRFTVYVHTNGEWSSADKGTEIVVRLYVKESVQATFTVKSQCEAGESDGPGKSGKPEKPGKSAKSDKSKKGE